MLKSGEEGTIIYKQLFIYYNYYGNVNIKLEESSYV